MRILFALSALLWSCLVGRSLSIGINVGILKLQILDADSWYNLTPIQRRIPPILVKYSPILIGILSFPILLIDDELIHCIAVVALVSEHCYIPMFIARINQSMSVWAGVNLILNMTLFCILKFQWIIFCQMFKIILFIWYLSVELQLGDDIVREMENSGRQPRV